MSFVKDLFKSFVHLLGCLQKLYIYYQIYLYILGIMCSSRYEQIHTSTSTFLLRIFFSRFVACLLISLSLLISGKLSFFLGILMKFNFPIFLWLPISVSYLRNLIWPKYTKMLYFSPRPQVVVALRVRSKYPVTLIHSLISCGFSCFQIIQDFLCV